MRVHLGLVGREQVVDARRGQLVAVGLETARIFLEVLAGPELQPVDEDGGHHGVAVVARLLHQRDVPFVEVAHGRHQRNPAGRFQRGAQAGNGLVDLHSAQ